jgi:hypothetical protein
MSFERHMKYQLVASCTVGQALGRNDLFWTVVFMKVVEWRSPARASLFSDKN